MEIGKQINLAAKIIKEGGLVIFPTETVYGLGANALNPDAVAKIFLEKERPSFDPLIVHICDIKDLEILCEKVDENVLKLANAFWPGPLTLVVKKNKIVPDIVTSGLDTVAIRMPDNEIALKLIEKSGCPIAAPSANKFGKLSPTTALHAKMQLPEINCIIDGGQTIVGIESTIIAFNSSGFQILRPGIITANQIKKILPLSPNTIFGNRNPIAPGLLKSHYKPSKPLYFIHENTHFDKSKAGLLSFCGENTDGYKTIEVLSKNKNLVEAAVNFFECLHKLEETNIEYIITEPVPETGIGIAIMDRLRKASYKTIA